MPDLKDTQADFKGLMSAVKDVMMKNQNLYHQDQMRQYGYKPPEESDVSGSDTETETEVSSEEPIEASAELDVDTTSDAEDASGQVADETGPEIDQG